jgi:hypothetical protein
MMGVSMLAGQTLVHGQSMRKLRIKYLLPPLRRSAVVISFEFDPSHGSSFFVRYAPIDGYHNLYLAPQLRRPPNSLISSAAFVIQPWIPIPKTPH